MIFGAGRAALALVLVIAAFGSSPSVRAEPFDIDPQVERIVAAVSQDRLVAILKKLESFGTRNTLSSVDSATMGIGAARQWIFDEMKGYSPKLQVMVISAASDSRIGVAEILSRRRFAHCSAMLRPTPPLNE